MFETLIAQRAAERPGDAAIRVADAAHDYATMDADIRRWAGWIGELRIPAGTRVLLQLHDPYLYWVLFFALEAHGVVSVGESAHAPVPPQTLRFLGVQLVISSLPQPEDKSAHWAQVGGAWRELIGSRPADPLPERVRGDDDPICIILSSGTTGTPKKVLMTRAMLDRRTRHAHDAGFLRDGARTLCALPFTSVGGVLAALQSWWVSGTIGIHGAGHDWAAALAGGSYDTILGAPIHLEGMLAAIGATGPRDDGMAVLCGGGLLSQPLATALRARLTDRLIIGYGTTESGVVTKADGAAVGGAEESAGAVLPWMEAQVIDAAGAPLPAGTSGEIRLRGEDVVGSYLDQPEESARYFRDGWYHPGDIGTLSADGVLTVSGRTDELINLGGLKAMPSAIEGALLKLAGVRDAAAFTAVADGQPTLWLAYVGERAVDVSPVADRIGHGVPLRTVRVETIPRNPMGKIMRPALRQLAEAGMMPGLADTPPDRS